MIGFQNSFSNHIQHHSFLQRMEGNEQIFQPYRVQDDYNSKGFLSMHLIKDLSSVAENWGFDNIKRELENAELRIEYLPEDGGPFWTDYIDHFLAESSNPSLFNFPIL